MIWISVIALALGYAVGWAIAVARLSPAQAAEASALRTEVTLLHADLARERTRVNDELRQSIAVAAEGALHASSVALVTTAAQQLGAQREAAVGDLQRVLAPLGLEIGALKESVNQLDRARVEGEASTRAAVGQLAVGSGELRAAIDLQRAETARLVGALKDSRQRGRWGEITLRNVIEKVGMTEHADFLDQTKVDGMPGRPDVIIALPSGAMVPIDAKASLDSYYAATEAQTAEEQHAKLLANSRALRGHVREIAKRGYPASVNGVGFAVLFVPLESVLSAALSIDPALLEDAIDQGVLLASPVTLIAYLRGFAHSWAVHKQSVNAGELVAKARTLVERLDVWLDHLGDVGASVERLVKKWNEAAGSYDARLAPTSREIRALGDLETERAPLPRVLALPRVIAGFAQPEDIR